MNTIAIGKYTSFQCLADRCTATCCAGWSILIDEKDYRRFENIEPEWLRKDILTSVQKCEGKYFFKNDARGRCAMLDEDGLCRIQRNTSEETLCNTCRKYPRLVNSVEGTLYLSMAASCPVVSEYLVKDKIDWLLIDDLGIGKRISVCDIKHMNAVWSTYQKSMEAAKQLQNETDNTSILYSCFERMTAGILDIVLRYRDNILSPELFSVLEEDISGKLEFFLRDTQEVWQKLVENYMEYRIVTRRIEFPDEADSFCIKQACGELFLLRTLLFCRYSKEGILTEKDLTENLQKVYRYSAHGKKVVEAFQRFISTFFLQDILWCYVLL